VVIQNAGQDLGMAAPRALAFAQDLKGQILLPILFWSLFQNSTKNYTVVKSPPSW